MANKNVFIIVAGSYTVIFKSNLSFIAKLDKSDIFYSSNLLTSDHVCFVASQFLTPVPDIHILPLFSILYTFFIYLSEQY